MTIDIKEFVRKFEVAVVTQEINAAFYRWRYSVPVREVDVHRFLDLYTNGTETIDQILKIWSNPPKMDQDEFWARWDAWNEAHPEYWNVPPRGAQD